MIEQFEKDQRFISGRFKSIGFALKGAWQLMSTEHSVMVQSTLGLVLVAAGFYLNISRVEWMMQCFAFGLVLSVEGLNTAVEKLADFVHPGYHEKIGFIKDIAAGAVFFAALTALTVIALIYLPYLLP
ncbi:MAG: diacylglycerol kinase [Flavobacterium sp. BFFFF2]|nr:MAG: diacylglycerol kinase [Flavobacterium sp. BFFFF2]